MSATIETEARTEGGPSAMVAAPAGRITSMDQFRGYTVFGMFLVNFVGGLAVFPAILKHNNTYFSYADSIMPSFMFACGFSFRLSMLRRLERGPGAYAHAIRRSLSLVLVSLVVYAAEDLDAFRAWSDMTWPNIAEFLASTIKANLWEVLAIIGVAQLIILPVVTRSGWVRFAAIVAFLVIHLGISHWFNYDFVYGRPNAVDPLFAGIDNRAWDGGCFGLIMWAVPMLAGTLVYDLMRSTTPGKSAAVLIVAGSLVMGLGYAASCLTRAYDVAKGEAGSDDKLAASPVIPEVGRLTSQPFREALAEPPFVAPPGPEVRRLNYWMMDKRVVTISFTTFATGFALALYGLFVVACDLMGLSWGVFRLLGMNPLAAYVIHHAVGGLMGVVTPEDSPLWWCLVSLTIFYAITLGFVKFLDDRKIFIRL
jgi:predicted acyltransferase